LHGRLGAAWFVATLLSGLKLKDSTNYCISCVHFASHSEQLPKCFEDNSRVTASRLAVSAWEMAHGNFLHCHAKPGYLSEDFRVHHRAHRVDLNFVEDTPLEDLESAIDVTDPNSEHESH
jgi:hypothetical protein